MENVNITYKEETTKEGLKYHYYKNNVHIATIYEDETIELYKIVTIKELKYILKIASV